MFYKRVLSFIVFTVLMTAILFSSGNRDYTEKLDELRKKVVDKGVPEEWFNKNLEHEKFKLHTNISKYFNNLAEHKVSRNEKDINWYYRMFGVDAKIKKAEKFIRKHKEALLAAEKKNGIHYEMMVAIIGMETNYAENRQRGNFYVFNSLVSQYLFTDRKRFSVNELAALYDFSKKSEKSTYYYIGSFAGACGWGQFIPTSLKAYFIDSHDQDSDIDVFSVDDTIFSIENYLHNHGLNSKTISNKDKRYYAAHAYNHSDAYVKATLKIYDALRTERKQ